MFIIYLLDEYPWEMKYEKYFFDSSFWAKTMEVKQSC